MMRLQVTLSASPPEAPRAAGLPRGWRVPVAVDPWGAQSQGDLASRTFTDWMAPAARRESRFLAGRPGARTPPSLWQLRVPRGGAGGEARSTLG